MIVGTTLFKLDGNPYYSPEFPRGGLAGVFVIDVTHVVSTPDVTVTIEHRNAEDTSFAAAATFSTISAVGTAIQEATSLKEIIRLKFTFDAGDGALAGLHFVLQAPTWRPYD